MGNPLMSSCSFCVAQTMTIDAPPEVLPRGQKITPFSADENGKMSVGVFPNFPFKSFPTFRGHCKGQKEGV